MDNKNIAIKHPVRRLLDSVWNTPHLVTQAALEPIVDYLQLRNSDNPMFGITPDTVEPVKKEAVNNIGEIKVDGVLTYKPIIGACGPVGVSYCGILEEMAMLVDMGVTTVIMTHSSSGGQASHAFSTAQEIRAMADEHGIKLIAYIDTLSASASYLLACVADEVIIHPEASAGSIGCIVALYDTSKAMEQAGVKPIYITSTAGKAPFNADGSFSDTFLNNIQEDVTRLGDKFVQHVHNHTGIPVEEIYAMDAQVFHAEKALELGLVNKVMDHKQFSAYIADIKEQ